MIHHGEEPCLVLSGGSGAVFFCGCALRCVYCQNAAISWDRPHEFGRIYNVDDLLDAFVSLIGQGVQNINLINAAPYFPVVTDALRRLRDYELVNNIQHTPIVWNSSGYESIDTIDALNGLVDIYLPDYKYDDSEQADLLSSAPDYPQVAQSAILRMRAQAGPAVYDERGAMQRGTMIRHLILPGFIRESIQALNWLADHLPSGTPVSLMGQYTPCARAVEFGLTSPLSLGAYRLVKQHRALVGLTDGYNQPPTASGESMIPIWDLE